MDETEVKEMLIKVQMMEQELKILKKEIPSNVQPAVVNDPRLPGTQPTQLQHPEALPSKPNRPLSDAEIVKIEHTVLETATPEETSLYNVWKSGNLLVPVDWNYCFYSSPSSPEDVLMYKLAIPAICTLYNNPTLNLGNCKWFYSNNPHLIPLVNCVLRMEDAKKAAAEREGTINHQNHNDIYQKPNQYSHAANQYPSSHEQRKYQSNYEQQPRHAGHAQRPYQYNSESASSPLHNDQRESNYNRFYKSSYEQDYYRTVRSYGTPRSDYRHIQMSPQSNTSVRSEPVWNNKSDPKSQSNSQHPQPRKRERSPSLTIFALSPPPVNRYSAETEEIVLRFAPPVEKRQYLEWKAGKTPPVSEWKQLSRDNFNKNKTDKNLRSTEALRIIYNMSRLNERHYRWYIKEYYDAVPLVNCIVKMEAARKAEMERNRAGASENTRSKSFSSNYEAGDKKYDAHYGTPNDYKTRSGPHGQKRVLELEKRSHAKVGVDDYYQKNNDYFDEKFPKFVEKREWAPVWRDDDYSEDERKAFINEEDKGAVYSTIHSKRSAKEDRWRWPSPEKYIKKDPAFDVRMPVYSPRDSRTSTRPIESRQRSSSYYGQMPPTPRDSDTYTPLNNAAYYSNDKSSKDGRQDSSRYSKASTVRNLTWKITTTVGENNRSGGWEAEEWNKGFKKAQESRNDEDALSEGEITPINRLSPQLNENTQKNRSKL